MYELLKRAAAPHIETLLSLFVANVITIVLAIMFDWPLMTLVLTYWMQSVIIGFFSRRRMLALNRFSTEGFSSDGVQLEPTEKTKRSTANFFALHYGFFHLIYMVFLFRNVWHLSETDWLAIGAAVIPFIANHWYSYRRSVARDAQGCPNIGTLMFMPYARIIPMHLTIIIGGLTDLKGLFPLLIFGTLKIGADMFMHVVEKTVEGQEVKLGAMLAKRGADRG